LCDISAFDSKEEAITAWNTRTQKEKRFGEVMGNMENILELATAKLKEMYGDDFKFEKDDEFVFALNNGLLMLSYDDGIKIKIMLDTVIPLDVDFEMQGGD
jgi:hypothetical protein